MPVKMKYLILQIVPEEKVKSLRKNLNAEATGKGAY